jgi:hypothetical protein
VTAGWQGGGESTGAATVADQLRTHANFFYIFLIILQNYMTVSKFYNFDNHSPGATAVRQSPVGPNGHGGQLPWATVADV